MSLVRARWIVIAIAGALAIVAPIAILRSGDALAPASIPDVQTRLAVREVGGLKFALAAPPFDPDRTPAPAGSDPGQTPQQPAAPLPTLVGLVTGGGGRSVALVRATSGETLMLAPGEVVDGWQLVDVGREKAVFALNGDRQTATLDFSNKTANASGPPSPPAPPAALPASSQPMQPAFIPAVVPPVPDRKQL